MRCEECWAEITGAFSTEAQVPSLLRCSMSGRDRGVHRRGHRRNGTMFRLAADSVGSGWCVPASLAVLDGAFHGALVFGGESESLLGEPVGGTQSRGVGKTSMRRSVLSPQRVVHAPAVMMQVRERVPWREHEQRPREELVPLGQVPVRVLARRHRRGQIGPAEERHREARPTVSLREITGAQHRSVGNADLTPSARARTCWDCAHFDVSLRSGIAARRARRGCALVHRGTSTGCTPFRHEAAADD